MRKKLKGFSLVELVTVVIIVGLLAGLAVLKLADAKERADTNYLKSMISMMEKGIERVLTLEGTFPTITAETPDARVAEILAVLESKNIIVYLGDTYGEKWNDAYRQYKLVLASQDDSNTTGIRGNLGKIRGTAVSGSPEAREILVFPKEGPIVYPETVTLTYNDPSNPNYAFHYEEVWLPLELRAAELGLSTNTLTDEQRALLLANVNKTNLTSAELKDLILANATSADVLKTGQALIDALTGDTTSNLAQEDIKELLSQLLASDANISQLDISKLDLTDIDPLLLSKLVSMPSLSDEQASYLSDYFFNNNEGSMLAKLLANPALSRDAVDDILDVVGGLTYADFTDPNNYSAQAILNGYLYGNSVDPYVAQRLLQTYQTAFAEQYPNGVPATFTGDNAWNDMYMATAYLPNLLSNLAAREGAEWTPELDTLLRNHILSLPNSATSYYGLPNFNNVTLSPATLDALATKFQSASGNYAGTFLGTLLGQTDNLSASNISAIKNKVGTSNINNLTMYGNYGLFSKGFYDSNELQQIITTVLANPTNAAAGSLIVNSFFSNTPNPNLTAAQKTQLISAVVDNPGTNLAVNALSMFYKEDVKQSLSTAQKASLANTLISRGGDYRYTFPLSTVQFSDADNLRILNTLAANPSGQLAYNYLTGNPTFNADTLAFLQNNINTSNGNMLSAISYLAGNALSPTSSKAPNIDSAELAQLASIIGNAPLNTLARLTSSAALTPTTQQLANTYFERATASTYTGYDGSLFDKASDPTKAQVETNIVNSSYSNLSLASAIVPYASTNFNESYLGHLANNLSSTAVQNTSLWNIGSLIASATEDSAVAQNISAIVESAPASSNLYQSIANTVLSQAAPTTPVYQTVFSKELENIDSNPWNIAYAIYGKGSNSSQYSEVISTAVAKVATSSVDTMDSYLWAMDEALWNNQGNPEAYKQDLKTAGTTLIGLLASPVASQSYALPTMIANYKNNPQFVAALSLDELRVLQASGYW